MANQRTKTGGFIEIIRLIRTSIAIYSNVSNTVRVPKIYRRDRDNNLASRLDLRPTAARNTPSVVYFRFSITRLYFRRCFRRNFVAAKREVKRRRLCRFQYRQ